MQYQVNLDPALMQSYRVTFNEVFGAIAANNANLGAKVVAQNGQEPALPEGVRIVPFYDQTELVEAAVNTLVRDLIQESILMSIIIILFLGHIRSSLIVTHVIPLGILLAFIAMKQIGLSANLMSLGGIAIGIGVIGPPCNGCCNTTALPYWFRHLQSRAVSHSLRLLAQP
jgi:Cu/Ag efflux pump CusA